MIGFDVSEALRKILCLLSERTTFLTKTLLVSTIEMIPLEVLAA